MYKLLLILNNNIKILKTRKTFNEIQELKDKLVKEYNKKIIEVSIVGHDESLTTEVKK